MARVRCVRAAPGGGWVIVNGKKTNWYANRFHSYRAAIERRVIAELRAITVGFAECAYEET